MLFLLPLLVGCQDISLGKIEIREAEVLVHPTHIDFGSLVSGQESDQKYFTVTNTGDDDLIITSPFLIENQAQRFDMPESADEDIVILPGELVQFNVTYVPETFESNEGLIAFDTTDEDEPYLEVQVTGNGDAPVATVSPTEFDYGDISIGCDNEERITITNSGNLDLVVEDVVQMVTQPVDILLEFGSLPELPWTIEPDQSLDFLVSYIPNDIGGDESRITINSNDPLNPVVETVQVGTGDVEESFTETHIQEEIPVLDILWVIDDSGSMHRWQSMLSSNIQNFTNIFTTGQADYNMAVITTSDPQIGLIIDSTTPNATYMMQNQIMVGTSGSGVERGLAMAYEALTDAGSAGPGSQFWRDNSILVVIFVSDEPDHSTSNIHFYNHFFSNLKPAGQFMPYAIM